MSAETIVKGVWKIRFPFTKERLYQEWYYKVSEHFLFRVIEYKENNTCSSEVIATHKDWLTIWEKNGIKSLKEAQQAAERNFLRIITESLNNFGVLGNPGWLEEVVHKANLKNYLLAQGAFEETLKEYVNTLEEIMKERL